MKKLFILFLMTNFYTIYTAHQSYYYSIYKHADPRLTEDQKLYAVVSTILGDVFTKKNATDLSFTHINDHRGQYLHLTTGFGNPFSLTLYKGDPVLNAAAAQLDLYYTDDNHILDSLKRIIRQEEPGRITVPAQAHQGNNLV